MIDKKLDYLMRGGSHPNQRVEEMEQKISETALKMFLSSPHFSRKGLRWTYNWAHFNTLYSTRDPERLKYLYDVRPYPDYIEVETSTHCNLLCTMCEHSYWKEKNQNMTYEQFLYILNQFPKLKWIGLTGIGESYLNPDFPKMLAEVKKRGIYVENFDNFVLLNEDRARQLVELGIDKIYVSLDAATKETYEKIRVGANWDKVVENIKTLDRIKKENNSHWPELWFHFIVSKDNVHELELYLDVINQMKVDVTRVQYTILLHPYKEIQDKFVEVTDEKKQGVYNKGKELGMEVSFNMNTATCKSLLSTCSVWYMPFIFVDGTVIPCCSMNEQNDRTWQKKTSLGNIFEEDFRKIWYGKKYTHMLESIRQNKNCEQCERCFLFNRGEK